MEMFASPVEFIAWISLIIGFVLALVGTVVPGLPGAVFVVLGILAHKLLLPDFFSWWTIVIIIVLALVSWIIDFVAGVWGAKLGGASKYGIIGAAIGGLLGLPLGLIGLLIGPFLGAVVGDIIAKRRDLMGLLKSGSGAAFGYILSLAARFVILVLMLIPIMFNAAVKI